MYFKRESERQDQEPHCKPKESEEQNLNWTQKKFKMNINKQEPETGKILIAKRFVKKTWRRNGPFYSSQRYIGHATAHTRERGWGWLALNPFLFKENGWS